MYWGQKISLIKVRSVWLQLSEHCRNSLRRGIGCSKFLSYTAKKQTNKTKQNRKKAICLSIFLFRQYSSTQGLFYTSHVIENWEIFPLFKIFLVANDIWKVKTCLDIFSLDIICSSNDFRLSECIRKNRATKLLTWLSNLDGMFFFSGLAFDQAYRISNESK